MHNFTLLVLLLWYCRGAKTRLESRAVGTVPITPPLG